ncbi:DUF262 domain-containing protein [Streptococcus ruminantium]|uniref:DUF262 domain-containing protein n=1 Tax=Streptococcus ruminantium TaxID=1917441 RepID=UPI0012DE1F41|nr:DUF262 domain-containing protein [Streptococcus ruminantium]
MEFRPLDKTIRKIFDGDNTYMIPNFQREFSWKKKNYKEFLNDLLTSMDIKFNEENVKFDTNDDSDYFFGTILLVGNETNPKVEEPYTVVDGQQRLTTMTIFISAIKSIIEAIDSSYLTSFNDALLVRYKRKGKELESARLQNKALEPVLPVNILNIHNTRDNGSIHEANSESQNWLLESYNEFKTLLSKQSLLKLIVGDARLFNKFTDEEYIQLLENIGEHLLNSTVIAIYTPDENSANIIYRNFNSRGVPLTNTDLIKNEIFSVLDDTTGSATTLWNDTTENIYLSGKDMKKYLYHYMVFRKLVSTESQIYEKFMEKIESNSVEYTKFLNDLYKKSCYYLEFLTLPDGLQLFGVKNFFNTNNNFIAKKRLQFFNDTELEQVRVLLLRLFEAIDSKKITTTQFKEILAIITRHQILHLVAKTSPNTLASHYRKYLSRFDDASKVANDIDEFKKDFIKRMPTKDQVISNINTIQFSRSGRTSKNKKETALLKQILIELSLWNQKGTNKANNGTRFIFDSTIEHINDHANDWKNINNLGNLLLLEQSKHFSDKPKNEMYRMSDITLTKEFADKVADFSGDNDRINIRSEELITELYNKVLNGAK